MIFGVSFILCLIAAVAFSMVIGPEASFFMALHSGIGIGLAWVKPAMAEAGTRFTIRLVNGNDVTAEVLDGHAAYDPKGERLKS